MFQDEWLSLSINFFLKEFFEKGDFEKISRRQKSIKIFPGGKELKGCGQNMQPPSPSDGRKLV